MPGHRFFAPFRKDDSEIMLSDADELAHLSQVLRLRVGDMVEIVNGEGGLAVGELCAVGKRSATARARTMAFFARVARPRITIACAVPKRSRFETIIEKCTELGVDRIVPLRTGRTEGVARGVDDEARSRRFERVMISAAKQSKRLWFPEILPCLDFDSALGTLKRPGARFFLPWLEGERTALSTAVVSASGVGEYVFFIGPEGDFTPLEAAAAFRAGATAVSLGATVLKVDTAAMAVAAFMAQSLMHGEIVCPMGH